MKKLVNVNILKLLDACNKYISDKFILNFKLYLTDGFMIAVENFPDINKEIYEKFSDNNFMSHETWTEAYNYLAKENKLQKILDYMEVSALEVDDEGFYIPIGTEITIERNYQDYVSVCNIEDSWLPENWEVYIYVKDSLSQDELFEFFNYCKKNDIDFID